MSEIISKEKAMAMGLTPLTNGYTKHEAALMEKAIASLRLGGVRCRKVRTGSGIEIWRDSQGFIATRTETKRMLSKPPFKERTI